MSDDKKKTPDPKTPDGSKDGGKDGGKGKESKKKKPETFNQEQLDEKISARLKRERKDADEKTKTAVDEAVKESERLGKLDAEDKATELREKEKADIADERAKFTLEKNELAGQKQLLELELPATFIKFVLDADVEEMDKKIKDLHKVYTDAVAKGVKDGLKGDSPKDPSKPSNKSKEDLVTSF